MKRYGNQEIIDGFITGNAIGANQQLRTSNLGLTLVAGKLQATASDGSALSTDNPAYIVIQHSTSGKNITLKLTDANSFFEDSNGSSDIIGEEFGTTSSVAWGENRPFTIYAVNGDDTDSGLELAISPRPNAFVSPATANIGYHGNPAATPSDNNFFFLTSTNVTSTHNAKPAIAIGTIQMTKDGSDDWAVTSLSTSDGIGVFNYLYETWIMPLGQMGALANTFLTSTGNNVPTWATPANIIYNYTINRNGEISVSADTQSAGNCTEDGSAGGDTIAIVLPYKSSGFYNGFHGILSGRLRSDAVVTLLSITFLPNVTSFNIGKLSGNDFANVSENHFGDTGDDITAQFKYKAF